MIFKRILLRVSESSLVEPFNYPINRCISPSSLMKKMWSINRVKWTTLPSPLLLIQKPTPSGSPPNLMTIGP